VNQPVQLHGQWKHGNIIRKKLVGELQPPISPVFVLGPFNWEAQVMKPHDDDASEQAGLLESKRSGGNEHTEVTTPSVEKPPPRVVNEDE